MSDRCALLRISKFHIFLARATVGTSLYVWVRQLVSQSVSQLVSAFLFSKLILEYFLCPARAYTTLVVLV